MRSGAILLLLLLTPWGGLAASRSSKPEVWAAYYAWYEMPGTPIQRSNQWVDDDGLKPKSKANPLIGYYDSNDPDVVRWHLRLAKAAGIEAFLVSWWGSESGSGKAFEQVILPLAGEERVQVAMLCEIAQFHKRVEDAAGDVAATLSRVKDSPGYLRRNGEPVVYVYQVPFAPKLTPETFKCFCREVEKKCGAVFWVMDKVSNENDQGMHIPDRWLEIPEVDMFGFYGTFSVRRIWEERDLEPIYRSIARQARRAGKEILLPTHPGHDNSGFRTDEVFVIPRAGGKTLQGYLDAASKAKANVVLITSFNEWPETTVVEPSNSWEDPYQYLRIIAGMNKLTFNAPKPPREILDFNHGPVGAIPAGWTALLAGEGTPKWSIEEDASAPSPPFALKQSGWSPNPSFPICARTNVSIQNGFLQVRFKPINGTNDQAAGLVWRLQDANNYYIARANALENNVVLYKVERGKRQSLDIVGRVGGYGVNANVPPREWSVLRVEFEGSRSSVLLNGRQLFQVEDSTFAGPGAVGVWTKADSVVMFDDFECGGK